MHAIQISRFGGPEVLEPVDAVDPMAGVDQVVIDVRVIEVLFLDTQLRTGWGTEYFPMRPPWIPGTGVAGTIAATGVHVEPSRTGTRVIARTGNEGAYAAKVAVPAADAIAVPDGLDLALATAALHDGVLALDRLQHAGLRDGSRVLVTAAAGSLGHWFVPLAKAAGALVTAAAGGEQKVAALPGLGADRALDYSRPDWIDHAGGPFDVVFDGAGGAIGRAALHRTRSGGVFFGYGAASGEFATTDAVDGVRIVGIEPIADEAWRRHTSAALDLLARGTVHPRIGQRVPLERAADAHAAMADRSVIGKTVLTV